MNEDAARPAVLDGFANVEFPRESVLHSIEKDAILAPWNLCSKLLHNFTVRPRLSESTHIFEVASGVTGELRKFLLKVVGKTINDPGAPAFAFLACQDVASNFPIMQHKLGISCERGLNLSRPDTFLDRLDEAVIKLCSRLVHNCLRHMFSLHNSEKLS